MPVAATSNAIDTDLVSGLRLTLNRLARRIRQNADAGITQSQLSALVTVERCGPLPLGELAEAERIGPSSLTRIVAALEADGLVERAADPTDRRVALARITAKGRRLLKRARARSNEWLGQRLDLLDADQLEAVRRALPALQRLLGEGAQ